MDSSMGIGLGCVQWQQQRSFGGALARTHNSACGGRMVRRARELVCSEGGMTLSVSDDVAAALVVASTAVALL